MIAKDLLDEMERVGSLFATEKIPGRESTRLNVNDSMVEIGTIIGSTGVVIAPFQQVPIWFSSVFLRSWDNISYYSRSWYHDKIR